MLKYAQLLRRALGVLAVAIGKDEFSAGKLPDGGTQYRIGHQPRIVDVVDLLQKVVRIDIVPHHQSTQRCPIFQIELLLEGSGFVARQVQQFGYIGGHL